MRKHAICALLLLAVILTALFCALGCDRLDASASGSVQKHGGAKDARVDGPTTLRVAYGNAPPHLDSQRYEANTTVFATDPMHATLVSYDADMNLIPNLAVTWDFPEELVLEMRIRSDARFHNGTPVTAQDVKDSFDRVLDPAVESVFRVQLDAVREVEAVDDTVVRFLLSEPCAPLLDVLTWVVIIPKDSFATQATAPVGCGPYEFVSWEKGVKLTMKKAETYWDPDAIGPDWLEFSFYAKTEDEVDALLAHEVDICTWLPAMDYAAVTECGIQLADNRNATFYYIGMNCTQAPFDDVRVRQAVALAVDKEACLAYILEGYGDTCDIPLDKSSPYYDSRLHHARDVEKARRLLAEAGYPNGFTARINAPDTPTEGPLAELLQQQLAEVGIILNVERIEVAKYSDTVFLNQDFGFTVCGYNATGDPDSILSPYFSTGGVKNIFGYSNKRVDDLLKRASEEYDTKARKALYQEYFSIMLDEYPCVHLIEEKKYSAVWANVQNAEFHPDLRHDFTHVTFAQS